MKVKVDPSLCTAQGMCIELCPEVFELASEIAEVKMNPVRKECEKACREAAESCPTGAITIEE